MANLPIRSTALRRLSFSIPDLMLVQSWSEACGLAMAVRLDHGSDTEAFEEVLAFHTGAEHPWRFIMWRDEAAVYVRSLGSDRFRLYLSDPNARCLRGRFMSEVSPTSGDRARTLRYRSVADALAGLTPRRGVVVTDVMATVWPDNGTGGTRTA